MEDIPVSDTFVTATVDQETLSHMEGMRLVDEITRDHETPGPYDFVILAVPKGHGSLVAKAVSKFLTRLALTGRP